MHFFTYLQFKDDTMTFYFLSFLSPLQILLDFLFQKAIEHHDCHHVFFWSSTEVVLFYFPNRPATRRSFVLAQAKAGSTCDLTGFEKSFDVDLSCKWLKHLETEGCFRKRLDQELNGKRRTAAWNWFLSCSIQVYPRDRYRSERYWKILRYYFYISHTIIYHPCIWYIFTYNGKPIEIYHSCRYKYIPFPWMVTWVAYHSAVACLQAEGLQTPSLGWHPKFPIGNRRNIHPSKPPMSWG